MRALAKRRVVRRTTRTGSIALGFEEVLDFQIGHLEDLAEFCEQVVRDATLLGESRMMQILASAVTATGLARASRGGHSGRIDTGQMLEDISSRVDADEHGTVGTWGWINYVMAYYLYQEYGDENFHVRFQGMKALQGSYTQARELMIERLVDAGITVNR